MSSMFDSEVYQRRNATPCTQIDFGRLLRRLAWHAAEGVEIPENVHRPMPRRKDVELTVCHRPDVASRMWWTLRYMGIDGEPRSHSSQDLHLLLWRVATSEARIEEKQKLERKAAIEQPGLPTAEDLDRIAEEQRVREATK